MFQKPQKATLLRVIWMALAILLSINILQAQYYNIGEDAEGLKWQKAESKNFQIIYPKEGFSTERAANYLKLMEKFYGRYADTIGYNYGFCRRFPMVIHAYNAQSNGVTVWAPRQIDFYPLPEFNALYPQQWDASLALHEGRHAWQIAHFNKGLFGALYWIAGDQIVGAASGIYPSSWFLEGDAVVAETELSTTGRGRSGAFIQKILRTIDSAPKSWDNWRLGSTKYTSLTPYEFGYMINSMARYYTGDYNLSHKILSYEAHHPFNTKVVASAYKQYSGLTHKEYINDTVLNRFKALNTNKLMERLADSLKAASGSKSLKLGGFLKRSGVEKGYYAEFKHLHLLGKDSLVALVTGYGSATYLVLYTLNSASGGWVAKPLRYFSSSISRFTSYGSKLFWSEIIPSARWGQKAVSKIFTYDLKTEELASLTLDSDYLYSPLYSDGKLYAIEYFPEDGSSAINEYNLLSNRRLRSFNCNGQVLEICKIKGDIYFTQIEEDGLHLRNISNSFNLYAAEHSLRGLQASGDKIYFITDYFGGQYLCCYNLNLQQFELSSAEKDINSFALAPSGVFISKFHQNLGAFIEKTGLTEEALSPAMEFKYPLAEALTKQYEAFGKACDKAAPVQIKNYKKGAHLFRLHSWLPVYSDVNTANTGNYDVLAGEVKLGATLYSQNTLGTAVAAVGYSYEYLGHNSWAWNENLHAAHVKFSYSGLYPVLEASFHFNDKEMYKYGTHSARGYVGAYIPWNFSSNGWQRGVTPQLYWSYRNDMEIIKDEHLAQTEKHLLLFGLNAYALCPASKAQAFPRWGIGGSLQASQTPGGGDDFGGVIGGSLYGYLPGFQFSQGLKWSATYQWQAVAKHRYYSDNLFALPRGYKEDIYGKSYYKLSLDYAIPVYLGDISLGLAAYLKRLDIIPFIDYAKVEQADGWRNITSFGSDILLRAHFIRIGFPISVGVRYAHTARPTDFINARFYGDSSHNYISLLFGITLK